MRDPPGRHLRVGMIGPGLDVRGGMSSVCRAWLASPGLADVDVDYCSTVGEGSRPHKALSMGAGQARFLAGLALRGLPDLFHIHVAARRSFYRKSLYFEQARAARRPVVVHIHGSAFEEFHDSSEINAAAIRRMFRRATLVVALSHHAEELFSRWTGGNACVRVLHNPVVISWFDGALAARDTRRGAAAAGRPATVLFMGLIGQRKGAFDLLAVVPELARRFPGTRFRFGGNGEVQRLREEARRLGVQHCVDVLGWVDGDAKHQEYARADVYCLPSLHEGMPVSVLEAMAARLPVVSTAVAGTPEACIDGETGFLIGPRDRAALLDRLAKLLADPGLRRRMGEAGRARAEREFECEALVRRLRGLWQEAMGRATRIVGRFGGASGCRLRASGPFR